MMLSCCPCMSRAPVSSTHFRNPLTTWEKTALLITLLALLLIVVGSSLANESFALSGLYICNTVLALGLVFSAIRKSSWYMRKFIMERSFDVELAKLCLKMPREAFLASEILPGVYVGSQKGLECLNDPSLIAENTPRHLHRDMGHEHVTFLNKHLKHLDVISIGTLYHQSDAYHSHLVVNDIADNSNGWPQLAVHLEHIYNTIETSRAAGRPVFVHCRGGINRSPTAILYYLMRKYQVPFANALGFLQNQRSIILPNNCSRWHLQKYEETGSLPLVKLPEWRSDVQRKVVLKDPLYFNEVWG